MPREEDDDFETGEKPVEKPVEKKFKSVYLRDAEELGISQEDIDECDTNGELLDLLRHQREKLADRRRSQPATEQRKPQFDPEGERSGSTKPAAAAEVEEDWALDDESMVDEFLAKEIKKVGKELLKAKKAGNNSERIEKLEKLVERQQAMMENQARRNHPLVRRGNAAVQKYAKLFGTEFDEDGRPPEGTFERLQYDKLMVHLFGNGTEAYPPHVEKDLDPEVNVARAVKKLFGIASAEPAEEEEETETEPEPKPKPASRIANWNGSGQAAPTNRNGASRTGIPDKSGREARKVKAASGLDDPENDDDDL